MSMRYPGPAFLGAGLAAVLLALPANAHPHVWIDVTVQVIFDEEGRFSAAKQTWAFDYEYGDSVRRQSDLDGDGRLDAAELAAMTTGPLGWIAHNDYFTRITVAARPVKADPVEVEARVASGRLIVEFTQELVEPVEVTLGAGIDVFDGEFYYDFQFAFPAIQASGAPEGCSAARRSQPNVDPAAAAMLRQLGLTGDPAILDDPAAGYAVRVAVTCG